MAHVFKVTKTSKRPAPARGGQLKHKQQHKQQQKQKSTAAKTKSTKTSKRLVVSAVSKTPITVTPLFKEKTQKTQKPKVQKPKAAEPQVAVHTEPAAADTPRRGRGRPRTNPPAVVPTAKRTVRPHRIDNTKLLEEAAQVRSNRVPLAARRIVEQLESLLARGSVETFRGRKKIEQLTLSKLEEQALQEALTLFQMKVTLQRGGSLRRAHAS